MKKDLKLLSLILVLALMLACMAGILTACGGNEDEKNHVHTFSTTEWASDATGHWRPATCEHKTERGSFGVHSFGMDGKCTICQYDGGQSQLEHTCETKCPICGKCLNSDCIESACQVKCGDDKAKATEFECEDPHTILTPGTSGQMAGPLNRNVHEEGADCTYVGGFNGNGGSAIEHKIVADKTAVVTIFARVCKRNSSVVFTQSVGLWVNGEIVERRTIVPAVNTASGENEWWTFTWCNLGCIELEQGTNSVKFQCLDTDVGKGFNFDKIKICSDEDVNFTWYEEPADTHVCESRCSVCGKCLNMDCDREACKEKCDGESRSEYRFDGTADAVRLTAGETGEPTKGEEKGNHYIGGLNGNKGAKVTFKISAEEAGVATLFVTVCKRNADIKFAESISTTVNGTLLTTPSVIRGVSQGEEEWHTYVTVSLGCVNLNNGENTIEFEVISDNVTMGFNLGGIVLKSVPKLSWTDGGKVAQDYRFDAENDHTKLVEGTTGMPDRGGDSEGVGSIGNFNANLGAKIVFFIKSEEACTAKLSVSVCKRPGPVTFTDSVSVKVNGENFTSKSIVPAYDPDTEGDWHYYIAVELGNIQLKKGDNSVIFEVVEAAATKGFNFDAIILNASESLDWGEEVDIEPGITGPDYRFEGEDLHTVLGEGKGIDGQTPTMPTKGVEAGVGRVGGLNANPGSSVTFYIHASAAGMVNLSVSVGKRGNELVFTESMKVTVNGKDLESEARIPACGTDPEFNTYVIVDLGGIELSEGDNIIVFEMIKGDAVSGFNFDAIILHSDTIVLSWGEAPTAAPVLLPVDRKQY